MIKNLLNFIDNSKTAFHAVLNASNILTDKGFERLYENEYWNLKMGGKYYVVRNETSIIAFSIPSNDFNSLNMVASHTDSPKFKLKSNFQVKYNDDYQTLNTEVYGGPIYSTWLDKPLSIAGRIMVNTNNGIESKIVDIDRDLLVIPNLAIHFNREINSGYQYNPEIDLKPLLSNNTSLYDVIEKECNIKKNDIAAFDLELYVRDRSHILGGNKEFFNSPQIDNLECMYISLESFLASSDNEFKVFASFDNEEVGSTTKQGACSNMLIQVLERVYKSLGKNNEDLYIALANSILVSADNAHALHPNYIGKSDKTNAPIMNKGIVIKFNANQSYTTDAVSAGIFKTICKNANSLYQDFSNRSDIRGGGTLGNLLTSQVSMNMVDIGLGQFAMHSARETAGCLDVEYMYKALKEFYATKICKSKDNIYIIKK